MVMETKKIIRSKEKGGWNSSSSHMGGKHDQEAFEKLI